MFSEDELGVARANGFGSHDLVSEGIGHHAALVDARLVSESVGSDDGLVGRAAKGDTLGEHLAGGVELAQDDVVGVGKLVPANHEGGGDLFKGGVAGAFADAIDGALDLAGAAFDAGQRVGYGHTEVVVAVCGEDYVVNSRDAGFDQAEDRGVLLGGGVADGVGDVDGGGAGLDGDGDHLEEELGVGAGAVLGGELDVFGKGAGEADRLGGLVEGLVAGDAKLALEMKVGGGEDEVDAVGGGGLDGPSGGLDVFTFAAGERGDAGAADLAGHRLDSREVAVGGDGKSGLEDIDAKGRDLVG